jgi:cyclohexa-1,5-dienecarbonyl-CoA hydratase
MADYHKIRTEPFIDGQGLWVVLDDPKGNVLDGVMMGEINALLDDLKERPELKLIGFRGEGKHFSFGASVPDHVRDKAPRMLELFHGMFLRLVDLAVPTAAAVTGQCLGGGMELATFCNRVVVHPRAALGQPEIQLAVLPPVASLVLPLRLGQGRADELVLTGRSITGNEAQEMGLAEEVAEDPRADIEAWAAEHIAPKSAAALRCAVRTSRWRFNQLLGAELKAVERYYLDVLMATHDANEGLAAFLEKRKPQWKNS